MLFDETLRDLLSRTRTIAIVGAKDKPGSPVDRVGRYLLEAGYALAPVHPARKEVWGLPASASLADLPARGIAPDIVCLFRAPDYCPDHARETLALPSPPLLFWMQEGIRSPEAGAILAGSGIRIVEDLCLKTEHQRLFASNSKKPGPDIETFFSCRRCGHCCSGRGGIVLSPGDTARLCAQLGLEEADFLARYAEMRNAKPTLISGQDGCCIFYAPDCGCAVHQARPDVCRAWPFFRGNLVDAASFAMAKEDCPGIRADAAHADFARAGYDWLSAQGILAHDPRVDARALIVDPSELPVPPTSKDPA